VNSRLYKGTVAHARIRPKKNAFEYGVYYLYLDLAELDSLDSSLSKFGHNRKALASFWDVDHGPRDGTPLRPWIDGVLASAGIDLEGGRVCVLTFPRVMGSRFYPVSFWYCYHADGTPRAVLAEVQNTYRDHHNYLLHNNGARYSWETRPEHTKAFFVSPFVQLEDVRYRFSVTEPGDKLTVSLQDYVEGSLLLKTTLSLHAFPLTDESLSQTIWRTGPIAIRALILIHWQALKLLFKRVGIYPHTPPPAEETSL